MAERGEAVPAGPSPTRACWPCNLRRQSCDRVQSGCARCVKHGFLCAFPTDAWPWHGDPRAGPSPPLADSPEDYEDLAAAAGSTSLRLEKTACVACKAGRRRCNGQRPSCDRCQERGIECGYRDRVLGKRPPAGTVRPRNRPGSDLGPRVARSPRVKIKQEDEDSPRGAHSPSATSSSDTPDEKEGSSSSSRASLHSQSFAGPLVPVAATSAVTSAASRAGVSPLGTRPTDPLAFPPSLDSSSINWLISAFFRTFFQRVTGVTLHRPSFLASLRTSPDRAIVSFVMWQGAVFDGTVDARITRVLQATAWRNMVALRQRFWNEFPPDYEVGAAYMQCLVLGIYGSWRSVGIGAARRFHEELIRVGTRLGIQKAGSGGESGLMGPREWLVRQTILLCWWQEAFALDATLSQSTGTRATLDPFQWLDLEVPMDSDVFLSVNPDDSDLDGRVPMERLCAADIVAWTMLPQGSEERNAALEKLRAQRTIRWTSVLTFMLSHIIGEIARLQDWLKQNSLDLAYTLGVAEPWSPLVELGRQRREHILGLLEDCRKLIPAKLAECAYTALDGYAFVQEALPYGEVERTIGTVIGIDALTLQLISPPPFTEPPAAWLVSTDFADSIASAITITRIVTGALDHPAQGLIRLSTIPYVVLHASWIHVLSVRCLFKAVADDPTTLEVAREAFERDQLGIVHDLERCMDYIRKNASNGWTNMVSAVQLMKRTLEGEAAAVVGMEWKLVSKMPAAEDPLLEEVVDDA